MPTRRATARAELQLADRPDRALSCAAPDGAATWSRHRHRLAHSRHCTTLANTRENHFRGRRITKTPLRRQGRMPPSTADLPNLSKTPSTIALPPPMAPNGASGFGAHPQPRTKLELSTCAVNQNALELYVNEKDRVAKSGQSGWACRATWRMKPVDHWKAWGILQGWQTSAGLRPSVVEAASA